MEERVLLLQQLKPHCHKCGRRNRNHQHNYSIPKNILIDQLIQVQQLNGKVPQERIQQMIYLREKINNLSYREIHFPSEFIILKRLEEKNNLSNKNRFKVDQYFQSLKLQQYQTISTLFQNIPITSFIYSKEDSPPMIYHQQYSQNTNQSNIDNDAPPKDTTVVVDVRKYSQGIKHRSQIPKNGNHIIPIRNVPFPESNQSIYFDQYQPSQIRFFPYSQNSNSTPSLDHQISNQYHSSLTTSTNTTNNSKKTQTLNKIKQILNTLQDKFNQIHRSITSDSLITTHSVSQLSSKKSVINLEKGILQIEVDSLENNNYYPIRLRNTAKNINSNQQASDSDETLLLNQSQSERSISYRSTTTVHYMPPSFMFILQILLVLCFINQILIYNTFGIVAADSFVDKSQSCTPIPSTIMKKTKQTDGSMNNERFLSSIFRLL